MPTTGPASIADIAKSLDEMPLNRPFRMYVTGLIEMPVAAPNPEAARVDGELRSTDGWEPLLSLPGTDHEVVPQGSQITPALVRALLEMTVERPAVFAFAEVGAGERGNGAEGASGRAILQQHISTCITCAAEIDYSDGAWFNLGSQDCLDEYDEPMRDEDGVIYTHEPFD